ncbi:hypothetical protein VKT23_016625 [Stygiomarasmius scandens]|uniref:Uncharacterized protein n=1 Tax=Marasmiellus scandens TaxID=2682957 RepID=A0ABR1IUK3_9AGAR
MLLNGNEVAVGWRKLLDEHIVCMEDLQESEQKKIKAAKAKRASAARRARSGDIAIEGACEKHREPSWIWYGVSNTELGTDKVLHDGEDFFQTSENRLEPF